MVVVVECETAVLVQAPTYPPSWAGVRVTMICEFMLGSFSLFQLLRVKTKEGEWLILLEFRGFTIIKEQQQKYYDQNLEIVQSQFC